MGFQNGNEGDQLISEWSGPIGGRSAMVGPIRGISLAWGKRERKENGREEREIRKDKRV